MYFLLLFSAFFIISCASKEPVVAVSETLDSAKVDTTEVFRDPEALRDLRKEGKFDELHKQLQMWEAKEPNNLEMFVAYFNYYVNRKMTSQIMLGEDALYESRKFDKDDVVVAVGYLDKGLKIAPNRLDMRMGKIYILNEIERYEDAGNELYAALEASKKIDNKWLWRDNEEFGGGEKGFLSAAQGHYDLWFDKGTEAALKQFKRCTEKQIELYPEDVFAYNNMAGYYYAKKETQKVLEYLLQAELKAPNDCVVLLNIGKIYLEKEDKEKAKKYFTKVLDIGDEEEKDIAKYFLEKL